LNTALRIYTVQWFWQRITITVDEKRKAPQQIEVLETKKAKLLSVAAAGKISKEMHQLRYQKK